MEYRERGEGVNCMHGDRGVGDKAKNIQEFRGRERVVERKKGGNQSFDQAIPVTALLM